MGPSDRGQTKQHQPELSGPQGVPEGTIAAHGNPGEELERPVGGLARLAVAAIRGYQKTAKYRPPVCRFNPSCSEYTRQAIVRYGFLKGSAMGAWRICRCNPWSKGGYDPVP